MGNLDEIKYIPILCNKIIDCSTYKTNDIGFTNMEFVIDTILQGSYLASDNIFINEVVLYYDGIELLDFNNFVYINGRIIYLKGAKNSQQIIGNIKFNNSYYGIPIINQVCKKCLWNDCVDAKICGNIQLMHIINPRIFIKGTINCEEFLGHGVIPNSPIVQISEFGVDSERLFCQKLCLPISVKTFDLYMNFENKLNIECISPVENTLENNTFIGRVNSKLCIQRQVYALINGSLVSSATILKS